VRHNIYIGDDGASPLFAERRKHSEIVSYRGVPPTFFDGWVYPTIADLTPEAPLTHTDYDVDGLRRTIRGMAL